MNKRQRRILIEFVAVVTVTAVAVVAIINLKDWVNRAEAIRAMEQLAQKILEYRKAHGSIPPESYIDGIRESLEGYVRLGRLRYRGLWIDFESTGDEILAYTRRDYPSSLVSSGYVVLRLDGRVEWIGKDEFEPLLAQQQSQHEVEMLQRRDHDRSRWQPTLRH